MTHDENRYDGGGFQALIVRVKKMPASPQAAGAGKPWNIPLPRNPVSTGREAIFEQLQAALSSPGTAAALSGPEGIGKTQIAVEYAYRHEQDYTAVLWATANSRTMLMASFTALASLLDLNEKDAQNQTLVVLAV